MSSVTSQAFRALSIFTAYSERDEPFLDYVPAEGGKIFWVNPIVPIADEEMYAELKLESPASVEYHRLQPRVVELLQRRQSTRHLLVREPGSFNKFFASLQDRFQSRQHSRRVYHKDLTFLRVGPYPFLDYFDIPDAALCFSRVRDTSHLLALIRNPPLHRPCVRSHAGPVLTTLGVICLWELELYVARNLRGASCRG